MVVAASSSCGSTGTVADPVQPVTADDAPGSTRAPARDRTTPASPVTGPELFGGSTDGATDDATDAPTAGPGDVATEFPKMRERVEELLLRYDELVTRLAADPVAMLDPLHPVRVEWSTLVPADSALSTDVLGQLVIGPAARGTRLVPDEHGYSYRHRSLSVGPVVERTVEFTWCGYSPGVRVDTVSGRVVDDAVAYVHGTGRVVLDVAGWVIDALDHLRIDVQAPGSGDPCPAEQAALSTEDAS